MNLKRIFLISVDCLRADHVGCIGGGNLTPNIDKIARDSLVFTRAFANGPGTSQSFPSILTSTYFLMHGGRRLAPWVVTLAEALKAHGFKTVAFHSNPFLSSVFGWNKGFDEFYDFMERARRPSTAFFITKAHERKPSKIITNIAEALGITRIKLIERMRRKLSYLLTKFEMPYVEGKEINEHVIRWLKGWRGERLFLWVHYMDTHIPFAPPSSWLRFFRSREEALMFNGMVNLRNPSDEENEVLMKLYKGEVRYVDYCIGELIDHLRDIGLLDDALMVILADHGEAFKEHGIFGHGYDILYNEVIHVPLLIHGVEDHGYVKRFVELLDISPTILDLCGIRKPRTFLGNNLLRCETEKPIFSESAKPDPINLTYDTSRIAISCIANGWKIIINQMKGSIELYNLMNDPKETHNLIKTEPDIGSTLLDTVMKHLKDEKRLSVTFKIKKLKECS